MPLNRTRRRWWPWLSLAGVLCSIGLPMGIYLWGQHSAAAQLEAALQAWKATGGKASLLELKPLPIADEDNAAMVYERIFEEMATLSEEEQELLGMVPEAADPRRALTRFAAWIDLAHAGAAKPNCQWNSDYYEQGMKASIPQIRRLRSLARLLGASVQQSALEGRGEDAARATATMLRMAQHARSDPGLIQMLTSMGIEAIAYDAIRRHFGDLDAPPQSLLEAVEAADHRASAHAAMLADGATGLMAVQTDELIEQISGPRLDIELAKYLRTVTRATELVAQPYWQRSEDWRFLDDPDATGLFGTFQVGAWDKFDNSVAHTELNQHLAQAALQLRAHRRAHGSYPESFDMPIDPFTGKPLHYQREGDGFVIWSEGTMPGTDGERIEWRWN